MIDSVFKPRSIANPKIKEPTHAGRMARSPVRSTVLLKHGKCHTLGMRNIWSKTSHEANLTLHEINSVWDTGQIENRVSLPLPPSPSLFFFSRPVKRWLRSSDRDWLPSRLRLVRHYDSVLPETVLNPVSKSSLDVRNVMWCDARSLKIQNQLFLRQLVIVLSVFFVMRFRNQMSIAAKSQNCYASVGRTLAGLRPPRLR